MKLRTTMLTSAFATLVAVASCSDDSHKNVGPTTEAGAGGEGGESTPIGGQGGGGTGDTDAGLGVNGGVSGEGGTAGEGVIAGGSIGSLLLFTVDASSTGFPATGVSTSTHPQSEIFASGTASPSPLGGSNYGVISAAQLGIADSDAIDAFTVMQPTPAHPVYWFSVAPGVEGERPTRLARSTQNREAIADVYFSDGTMSFRSLGEGGDQLGYNGLVADEESLGLSPAGPRPTDGHLDNLTGVLLLPGVQLPSDLYFSVGAGSAGIPDAGVASVPPELRACTIFRSNLEGATIAFTCAELGLGPNSDVKGLALFGTAVPTEILFAVDTGSSGLAGTAVGSASALASDIFASPLDGTNTLRVEGKALGLAAADRLDALAVVDQSPAKYAYGATCTLSPAPDTPEGAGLERLKSAHSLGQELILVEGPASADASAVDGIGAYDLKTCAFVARSQVISSSLLSHLWTPVPLAGWSAAAPFSNLEYWTLANDGAGINRLDASGALLASYGFAGIASATFNGFALDYDPKLQRFHAVLEPRTGFPDYQRLAFPRPLGDIPNGTLLDVVNTPIPHPCADAPQFSGIDAQGNSLYAQFDAGTAFRVCALGPDPGEFASLPFTWSLQNQIPNYAALIPEDALYALFENNAFALERYPLVP